MSTDTFTLSRPRGYARRAGPRNLSGASFWSGFHIFDVDYLKTPAGFPGRRCHGVARSMPCSSRRAISKCARGSGDLAIEQLAALVTRLDEAGIPLPFSYVYDEFLEPFPARQQDHREGARPRLPASAGFLDLGASIRARSESGWSPHRDKKLPVAVRGPLAQVDDDLDSPDPEHPAERLHVRGAGRPRPDLWHARGTRSGSFAYADVRALPATHRGPSSAGTQAVLHWGSHACEREIDAAHFNGLRVPVRPGAADEPAVDVAPTRFRTFPFRLQLIAKQILQYRHMYPLAADVEAWAQDVLASSAG
jgi:hypothetical protein